MGGLGSEWGGGGEVFTCWAEVFVGWKKNLEGAVAMREGKTSSWKEEAGDGGLRHIVLEEITKS